MPIFLKDIKRELAKGANKKGYDSKGEPKHKPPTYVSRNLSDYTKLNVLKLDRIVRVGMKLVDFTGVVPSETKKGERYRVTVRFTDVLFGKNKSDIISNKVVVDSKQGKVIVYYKTPSISLNKVMLKCSCPDFRHRFEHELYDADSLIGAPRKYLRKTAPWPVGYPYANSTEKVGMCKHVFSMLTFLKKKGIIKER